MFKITTFFLIGLISFNVFPKNFIVYSIDHHIPTGENGTTETPQKNFYLNIGSLQGVEEGSILEVRRKVTKNNKFENNKEFTLHMRIGLIRVIEVFDNSSIAVSEEIYRENTTHPFTGFQSVMLGDHVNIPFD